MATPRQIRFARLMAEGQDAPLAAKNAGYSEANPAVEACRLLKDPKVLEMIEEQKQRIALVAHINPEWVLAKWIDRVNADPRKIMSLRRVACSKCDITPAYKALGLQFDPNCPHCLGEGVERPFFADTDTLTGAEARLFKGLKANGRGGIEILLHDQDKALENIANYLGMFKQRTELTGVDGGPLAISSDPKDLTDAQLAAIAAAGV